MALEITAIARCHRCNVISTMLNPIQSDPTHASVVIPFDWMGFRVFGDGQDDDFILCPDCKNEAWEWLQTKVERRPSSDGQCLAMYYDANGRTFCGLPAGHIGSHGDTPEPLADWEKELLGVNDPLEYVVMHAPQHNCRDRGVPHVWHNSFACLTHKPDDYAVMTRYCRECGVTYSSYSRKEQAR